MFVYTSNGQFSSENNTNNTNNINNGNNNKVDIKLGQKQTIVVDSELAEYGSLENLNSKKQVLIKKETEIEKNDELLINNSINKIDNATYDKKETISKNNIENIVVNENISPVDNNTKNNNENNNNSGIKKSVENKNKTLIKRATGFINRKNELHDFTINDYNRMSVAQALKYDQRSNWQYFWDRLKFVHYFIHAFLVERNQIPQVLRIAAFGFFISFQFALNAIFFSDSYISEKNDRGAVENDFSYTIRYQLSKSIWSAIIGSIPIILLNPLLKVPDNIYKEYNEGLLEYEPEKANKSLNTFYARMLWRYIIYTIIAIILHLLSWYYVTVFCSVYTKSSRNWLYGGIISLVIQLVVSQPMLPALRLVLRYFARSHTNG